MRRYDYLFSCSLALGDPSREVKKIQKSIAQIAPCSIKEQPKRNVLQRLAQRGELDLEEEGHGLYHL